MIQADTQRRLLQSDETYTIYIRRLCERPSLSDKASSVTYISLSKESVFNVLAFFNELNPNFLLKYLIFYLKTDEFSARR